MHTGSNLLITHRFVAVTWTLVDIPGLGCLGIPLVYVGQCYPLLLLVVASIALPQS